MANAYVRDPSLENARLCLNALLPAVQDRGHPELAYGVALVQARFPESVSRHDSNRLPPGPNLLAFSTLLQKLQELGRRSGWPIKVVQDEARQFERAYAFCHHVASLDLMSDLSEVLDRGHKRRAQSLKHVLTPQFAISQREPLVQAADLLAGMTACLLRTFMRSRAWKPCERTLAILLLGGFFKPDVRDYMALVVSSETGQAVGQAVVDALAIEVESSRSGESGR